MTVTNTVVRRPRSRLPHLVVHQFRFDLRCFWRNTQSRFFTLALPGPVSHHLLVHFPQHQSDGARGDDLRVCVLRPRHHRLRRDRCRVLESRLDCRALPGGGHLQAAACHPGSNERDHRWACPGGRHDRPGHHGRPACHWLESSIRPIFRVARPRPSFSTSSLAPSCSAASVSPSPPLSETQTQPNR